MRRPALPTASNQAVTALGGCEEDAGR
jgi:hypothetical protein